MQQQTTRLCPIDNCQKPRGKASLCPMHTSRRWRHGDVNAAPLVTTADPLPGEEWRPVIGYEGWYEVSDFGRVRRVKQYLIPVGLLKPISDACGYVRVSLRRSDLPPKRIRIHTLVAEAFIGARPSPDMSVNHKDGLKPNNRVGNLEWSTPSQQAQHAWDTGLSPRKRKGWSATHARRKQPGTS